MFQLTFLSIAAVSTIVSAATLRAGLRGLVEPETGVVGAAAGAAGWAVVALQATDVQVATGGSVISQSYPSVRVLAVVGFAAMLVAGLRAAIAALGGDTTAEVTDT